MEEYLIYDVEDFIENRNNLLPLINNFLISNNRKNIIDGLNYYKGRNTFINKIYRIFQLEFKDNNIFNSGKNSKFQLSNGIFKEIVNQPIDILTTEAPIIKFKKDKNNEIIKNFLGRSFGYNLKNALKKAVSQGVSFTYINLNKNKLEYTVFATENIMPFYNILENKLTACIRLILQNDNLKKIEIYELDGLSIYEINNNKMIQIKEKEPYLFNKIIYKNIEEQKEIINFKNGLPIIELKNNEERESSLANNIKTKIDAIDIISSDFCNTLTELQDVFWVIKNFGGSTDNEIKDFIQQIKDKKFIKLKNEGSAEPHTFNVPFEARKEFIESTKKEIRDESGIINFKEISGNALTIIAIKAIVQNLKSKINEIEWQAYLYIEQIINFSLEILKIDDNDFEIDFIKDFLNNETEIIDNVNKIKDKISLKSYLNILQKVGYIENVEDEIIELELESTSKLED